jgi:hypothetical protein
MMYNVQYPLDLFHEQPPFCSHNMTKEQLLIRIAFLKKTLKIYYSHAEEMDALKTCCDPYKFNKLKQYNEKRLKESEFFLRNYFS